MVKRVLVIAAHPDDELLGVGGTLARHSARGDIVDIVIVCTGNLKHEQGTHANVRNEALEAAKHIGAASVEFLEFKDQGLDEYPITDVVIALEKAVTSCKPNIVYLQHGGDVNRDHQILFKAALVACRPTVEHIETVYSFSTLSSTEWGYPRNFTPDTWVDISDYLQTKLDAMACYKTELREWPHPRSLKGITVQAQHSGASVLMEAAEAFMTVRRVARRENYDF